MPLQSSASSSNPLCLSEVRTELGLSSSTRICLGDSRVRTLAGKPSSGTICLSDLLGKGSAAYTITNTAVYGSGTRLVWYNGASSFTHYAYAYAYPRRLARFTFSNDTTTLLSLKFCTFEALGCGLATTPAVNACPAYTYQGSNEVEIFSGGHRTSVLNLGNKLYFPYGESIVGDATDQSANAREVNLSTETQVLSSLTFQGEPSFKIINRPGVSGISSYLCGGRTKPANKFDPQNVVGSVDKILLGASGTSPTVSRLSTTVNSQYMGMGFGNGSESYVAGGNNNLNSYTVAGSSGPIGGIRGINHSNDTSISVSSTINATYLGSGLGTSTTGYVCGGRLHGSVKQTNRIEQFTYSTKARSTLSNTISRALWGMGEISSRTAGYLFGGAANATDAGGYLAYFMSLQYFLSIPCDFTGSTFLAGNRGDIMTDQFQKMNYSTKTVSVISAKMSNLNQMGASGGQSVTATLGDTGW